MILVAKLHHLLLIVVLWIHLELDKKHMTIVYQFMETSNGNGTIAFDTLTTSDSVNTGTESLLIQVIF